MFEMENFLSREERCQNSQHCLIKRCLQTCPQSSVMLVRCPLLQAIGMHIKSELQHNHDG